MFSMHFSSVLVLWAILFPIYLLREIIFSLQSVRKDDMFCWLNAVWAQIDVWSPPGATFSAFCSKNLIGKREEGQHTDGENIFKAHQGENIIPARIEYFLALPTVARSLQDYQMISKKNWTKNASNKSQSSHNHILFFESEHTDNLIINATEMLTALRSTDIFMHFHTLSATFIYFLPLSSTFIQGSALVCFRSP